MLKSSYCANLCLIIALFGLFVFSSCVSSKRAIYFSDLEDSLKLKSILQTEFREPVIQPDDILSITIQTIDPLATAALNQASSGSVTASSSMNSGFLVDKTGSVEVPMLGIIKLSGLTTNEARDIVRREAARYYKDPTVQVRFVNYKITVIGEVAKPATYTVPNEKVSILDAIGMAGDLTIYGKRENVMLIRENGVSKDVIRLDLTSTSLFQSEYFYLRQNDVVYVEPTKAKIAANNSVTTQTITIGVSVLSLLITILTRL